MIRTLEVNQGLQEAVSVVRLCLALSLGVRCRGQSHVKIRLVERGLVQIRLVERARVKRS